MDRDELKVALKTFKDEAATKKANARELAINFIQAFKAMRTAQAEYTRLQKEEEDTAKEEAARAKGEADERAASEAEAAAARMAAKAEKAAAALAEKAAFDARIAAKRAATE